MSKGGIEGGPQTGLRLRAQPLPRRRRRSPGLWEHEPAQVEFDVGYGLGLHEGTGLLTTYGGLSLAGPDSHGVRVGGRIELGQWVDLSVEGERMTQGGTTDHQVALYALLSRRPSRITSAAGSNLLPGPWLATP